MEAISVSENDEIVMKLLHYFVTEQNYNPIILRGVQNEIWLENLESDYKIIRLVSNYIHNDDQMEMDMYRTEQIMKKIRKKTMSFSMNTLSIFVNIGEIVNTNASYSANIDWIKIDDINDINKFEFVLDEFPTITKVSKFKEQGFELFMKLTNEIGKKNEEDAKKAEDVFTKKSPVITKLFIAINIAVYILTLIYGKDYFINNFSNYGPFVKDGDIYRLLTAGFLHVSVIHLLCNMYALYVIGPQIESYFGKTKYLIIYLGSLITGNLLSIMFNPGTPSIGASGAIFGLLGAMLYFGYHYRVFLDDVIKSQIIPIIMLNLLLGFMASNIDSAGHIGGLIGGILLAKAVGVKYKSNNSNIVNGIIMALIFIGFLIYMVFFR